MLNFTFPCAPWHLTLARVFSQAGAPIYAIGGSVRNALMGLPASDFDVCGPTRPEAVFALCEGTPVHAVLRAAHFGTVELHVSNENGRHMAEYTTFRVDSYRCGHKPSAIRFADTANVDALRRDFSVNAMYRQLTPDGAGELLDPTGGLSHMRQSVLHTVTADPDQVLKDDGLRILRAARFQAELGFAPTAELLASAKKYAPLLNDIARERLHDELQKLLLSDLRYPTLTRREPPVAAGLRTLRDVGAWPTLFGRLVPREDAIAAQTAYRSPDGFPSISGKLALLFIDEAPDDVAAMMRSLHFSVKETEAAVWALQATQAVRDGRCTLFDAVRFGSLPMQNVVATLTALEGAVDSQTLARARELADALAQNALPLSLKALRINGHDVQALCAACGQPISRIGRILETLWQEVVEHGLPNERVALIARAERLLTVRD